MQLFTCVFLVWIMPIGVPMCGSNKVTYSFDVVEELHCVYFTNK